MMLPAPWLIVGSLVGAAVVAAGGFKAGHAYVTSQWDKERLERSQLALRYVERNLERQADMQLAAAARQARLAKDLKEARRANQEAMQQPLVCPPSGLLGDVEFPGLRERLRDARAQRRGGASAAAASVPGR